MTTPVSHRTTLIKSAVASRLLLLSLIILWRSLVSPYDTSAGLNPSCLADPSPSHPVGAQPLLPGLGSAVERSIVWDGVYYIRIAQCGYEYEQTYAFFPLLPICTSLLSRTALSPLVPVIGYRAVLGLSGYLINNVSFVLAALYFYRLSLAILKDPEASLRASILFCFNPASIFYSYSESLYALLSVGGVFYLLSGASNVAVLWLALSGLSRSNGMLNAGYIFFQAMHQVLVVAALRGICIFVPFMAFQAFGYYNLCLGRLPNELRPWCNRRLPLMYNYIQNQYWGVGFLKYFRIKQLPNFLLASPILSLALCSIISYARSRPRLFLSLGFRALAEEKSAEPLFSMEAVQEDAIPRNPATAFFVMHVQVATRFLSASAPLYWFAAYLMVSPGGSGYTIWAYSGAYILLGSLLFSNFFPFT
ncbi:hypothetical protein CDL15_Pgr025449 [Punica granatum]|uniref:GPI mannosyltransferase 2 n=1 Tax=Punica granatum TaxID=22663 RepID=A0A218WAZ7_PUNGR|nr:hypothetical protein CDL15_Pgr025449 [Punica granatum]